MENRITINSLEDIDRAAGEFLERIGDNKLIAFFAPMGAGKTTFTTALCRKLGVTDAVCSPTFTIVNEYRSACGEPVFHFDFYRIKRPAEVLDIGFEDYIYQPDALCFMEWPELIGEYLPEETVKVFIEETDDGSRTVTIE